METALSALNASNVFGELERQHQVLLLSGSAQADLSAGEVLFREGDAFDGTYLVMDGRLRVHAEGHGGGEVTLGEVTRGDVLGEMQLLTGGFRSASVTADEQSRLLKFPDQALRGLLSEHPALLDRLSDIVSRRLHREQLSRILMRLFGTLAPAVLEDLWQAVEWLVLVPGDMLFHEGDPADALYALLDGRLVVWTTRAGGRERLGEIVAGETVGEIDIISGEPRSASIQAAKRSLLVRMSRARFEEFALRFPTVYKVFAEVIVQRLARHASGNIPQVAREIVVLPHREDDALAAECIRRLTSALSAIGPTLHLSSAGLEARAGEFPFDIHQALQLPLHDVRNVRFNLWLRKQRRDHRFLLYEADTTLSNWTRLGMEQADECVIVARAGADPEPGAFERALPGDDLVAKRLAIVHSPGAAPTGTRRWLAPRPTTPHHHLRDGDDGTFARLARFLSGQAIGLVLAGGGAKGFAHIGVIEALHALGLPIDLIGGTSSGGMAAITYAIDLDPRRLAERNRINWVARRPERKLAVPVVSFLNHTAWDRIFHEGFGEIEMEDLWIPAFVISCNIDAGRTVVHERGPIWKAARATSSLPGLLAPVLIEGQAHVDGGVVNNMPTDVMRARTQGLVLAVSLGSPSTARMPFEAYPSPWRLLGKRFLPGWRSLSAHTVPKVLLQLATLGDHANAGDRAALADHVLAPPVQTYSMMDFRSLDALVGTGYDHAMMRVGELARDAAFQRRLRAAGVRLAASAREGVDAGA